MSEPEKQEGPETGTDVDRTADVTGDGDAADAADAATDPPGAVARAAAEDDRLPPGRWASELFD